MIGYKGLITLAAAAVIVVTAFSMSPADARTKKKPKQY